MQVVFDRDKKIEELEEMLKHLIDEKDIQSVKFTIEFLKRMDCVQLPKGHGSLIDADELLKDRHRAIPVINVIEAPTIIEADKE